MLKMLKKEFTLCLHPTAILFLFMAFMVFIPNYPYEVIFFFSGLSIFFICLTARENGDLAFSCLLPVKKSLVPLARILMAVILQTVLLVLTAVAITVKQLVLPADMQVNLAGNMANIAFLGFGAIVCGVFNVTFFPLHFKRPDKVGVPFVVASAAVFVLIGILIVLRWTVPFFSETICTVDPTNIVSKIIVLVVGLCLYALMTVCAAIVSVKHFEKVDF